MTTAAPGSTGPHPARTAVTLVTVVAITATAGLAFHRVFALAGLWPVIAVASAAPVALAALVSWPRRRPWPLWISVLATVAGWMLVAGMTLFHGDFGAIGGAVRDSWSGTLTTLLPAPSRPELLVLPHVLLWFAASAGAECALRSRAKAAPALPAVAVFGVALLLGVGGPGSNLPLAAAFVGLVALLVVVREGGRLGGVPAGVVVAAALGGLAVLSAPLLPVAGAPYDPRETVKAPPPQQRDSVSPLDRVSAWLQTPDQQLFTVRTTEPENWRLAVLDRFDGVTWSSGASFVPAGDRVPPLRHGGTRVRVDQRFTIQGLPGVWAPAADRPLTITGMGVTVDPASGVLTSATPLRSGQAYAVTSMVRDYDADELAGAEPARDAEAIAATALPETPGSTARTAQVPAFRALAQRITQDDGSAFQRAAALADHLRTTARYDAAGLPGHSYAQLKYFLGHRSGTSEQFATAYAVLARSIGLPARVVVGFRPGVGGNGTFEVRSGDVLVWPEVDFAGLGWVPFYPTPEEEARSHRSGSVPAGQTQQKLEAAQKNAASRDRGKGQGTNDQPPVRPPAPATPPPKPTPWWMYAIGAAAVLPVLYLAAVVALPLSRRRRRRTGPAPADRITGAWQQVLETLHTIGLPPSAAMTAHEVAGFGARTVPGVERDLEPLADLVNRSGYSGGRAGPEAAEAAWQHADQVAGAVGRSAGPARRLGRRLHPRALRGR